MKKVRLGVLVSGRGSNLQSIMAACREGRIDGTVVVVISDQEQALALEHAQKEDILSFWLDPAAFLTWQEYEQKLAQMIVEQEVDFLLLAGFMRVLSPLFIRAVQVPILNIHPSLLPAFAGLRAQQQALDYGVRYSGCTVHFVDEGVDTGPIILQEVVPVHPHDTEESLAQRILAKEHQLYPRVIQLLAEGRISRVGRKVIIAGEGE